MIHIISIYFMVAILLGAGFTVMNTKIQLNKELKSCISISIAFNSERRKALNQLFALNSKAESLRKKRKMTERFYRFAPPQAKAGAYAALQAVKAAQKVFRLYQQKLIYTLKVQTLKFISNSVMKDYSILRRPESALIKSNPKRSDSPSYEPVNNFAIVSRVSIRKEADLIENLPEFLKNFNTSNRGIVECGSNMKISKEKKIQLKLLGGRSF